MPIRSNICVCFVKSENGTIAVITALIMVLVFGVVGMATDFSRGSNLRSELQSSLDSALLAAAVAQKDKNADLEAIALRHLEASFNKVKLGVSVELLDFANENGLISATARVLLDNTVMPVMGNDDMIVNVSSSIAWGTGPARIAFVLDNTGSMAGTPIEELRSAATDVLTKLEDSVLADDALYVDIVPFAEYVRIGPDHWTKPWLDVPLDETESWESCTVTNATACTTEGSEYVDDGVTRSSTSTVCRVPDGEDEITQCTSQTSTYSFQGCVGSLHSPHNQDPSPPPGQKIPGLLRVNCPTAIEPLTTDFDKLRTTVTSMNASGMTYMPTGLIWGWRLLKDSAPYAAPRATKEDERRILILMTDGANTRSLNNPYHDASDITGANVLTSDLCTDIKADGIEIYTLAFNVSDPTTTALLEGCATNTATHAYQASGAGSLAAAFEKLGFSLMRMRVAG